MKKYALLSVYNKSKLEYLCSILKKYKINIISTGKTSLYIKNLGYKSENVSDLTNFKEVLDGRVKTLHPKIYSSLLYDRKNKKHISDFNKLKFPKIDFVIIDLYPFDDVFEKKINYKQSIDLIDIGGISLLRAAAKNFQYTTAISNIKDYILLNNNLKSNNGSTSLSFRKKMAAKVFETTSLYDNLINTWILRKKDVSLVLSHKYKKFLRYGENPHQKSFIYSCNKNSIANNVIQGKELSYNNILDVDSALDCIKEFSMPTCAIFKHNNPCGVSSNKDIKKAFVNARNCDPQSSFGGVIILNRNVKKDLCKKIINNFYEIIIAPAFNKDSLKILATKKNLIIIQSKNLQNYNSTNLKSINNGYLMQDKNNISISKKNIQCTSKNRATKKLLNDLIFAFKVCKHVKSNAIVLAKNLQTYGIGAGQMSRIDATKIAVMKNKKKNIGFVAASDAFFPFSDSVKLLINNKCKAIIQPKGSINDKKIIKFCKNKKIPLYFSNYRLFKH